MLQAVPRLQELRSDASSQAGLVRNTSDADEGESDPQPEKETRLDSMRMMRQAEDTQALQQHGAEPMLGLEAGARPPPAKR